MGRKQTVITQVMILVIVILAFSVLTIGVSANVAKNEVEVIDALGREVKLELPIETIVSIAPSNTEILFALGLGDRVVGVTEACDYPKEAESKPKVGQVEMNIEKIMELSPDLVVAVGSMQLPVIEALSNLGMPVLVLDPKTLSDVLDSITLVGMATGTKIQRNYLCRNSK